MLLVLWLSIGYRQAMAMAFNEEEKAYLSSQRLARLATVSADGQPDVAPVGFEFDGTDFYIAGLDLPSTRKYHNVVGGNHKVALVIDDLVSTAPFVPRFVRVYGMASVVQRDGGSGAREYLRVRPTVSWSWNLQGRPRNGGQFRPRKVVHEGFETTAT
jgi:pyridoxamine 5'-phosphate oxidase family protein